MKVYRKEGRVNKKKTRKANWVESKGRTEPNVVPIKEEVKLSIETTAKPMKPMTLAQFLDGSQENFARLSSLPTSFWGNALTVHTIKSSWEKLKPVGCLVKLWD